MSQYSTCECLNILYVNVSIFYMWMSQYSICECPLACLISKTALTLSWPAGHICPTYKESFQVRWGNSIPLFLHAALYLEVPLLRWTSQNAQMILCAMLHSSIAHSIICTRLFRGKMHSDWFKGIEVLQGRVQHGEKVGYCYPSVLEKTLCKWDILCSAGHERVNDAD